MNQLPPRATRTDTPFPYPTLFRAREIVEAALSGRQVSVVVEPCPCLGDELAPILHRAGLLAQVSGQRPLGGRRAGPKSKCLHGRLLRSEEHTSELQSLMRISYAVFCLKKKQTIKPNTNMHKY